MTDTNYTYPDEVWHDGQHRYLSTACLHDFHGHCQGATNLQGRVEGSGSMQVVPVQVHLPLPQPFAR